MLSHTAGPFPDSRRKDSLAVVSSVLIRIPVMAPHQPVAAAQPVLEQGQRHSATDAKRLIGFGLLRRPHVPRDLDKAAKRAAHRPFDKGSPPCCPAGANGRQWFSPAPSSPRGRAPRWRKNFPANT